MKFGKSLFQVIELSDPEWGPYWINYKYLKKKINEIVIEQQENLQSKPQQRHHNDNHNHQQSENEQKDSSSSTERMNERQQQEKEHQSLEQSEDENNAPNESHGKILKQQLSQSNAEVEFFKLLKKELKKTSDFFATSEILCKIRKERLWGGLEMLKNQNSSFDDTNAWTRLMASCVRFYKDVLLLENYAIMNYCGFSKILKKHDKRTGYSTRDAFMIKVMSKQNFTQYPYIVKQLKEVEAMFEEIQKLHSLKPILEEEKMFIAAIRDLNYQASQLQNEENSSLQFEESRQRSSHRHHHSSQISSQHKQSEQQSAESLELVPNSPPSTRSDALLEASIRAVVADPAPNMQSILTWMHSVSTTGALVPIPATTSYLPRGLGQEKSKGTQSDGISFYTPSYPPTSSSQSTKPSLPQRDYDTSQRVSFSSQPYPLPQSSMTSTISTSSSISHRKHRLSGEEDDGRYSSKRRMLEVNATPSVTDSLCTEDQSLPDESILSEDDDGIEGEGGNMHGDQSLG